MMRLLDRFHRAMLWGVEDDRVRSVAVKEGFSDQLVTVVVQLIASLAFYFAYEFFRTHWYLIAALVVWCLCALALWIGEMALKRWISQAPDGMDVLDARVSRRFAIAAGYIALLMPSSLSVMTVAALMHDPSGLNSPAVIGALIYFFGSFMKSIREPFPLCMNVVALLMPLIIFFSLQSTYNDWVNAAFFTMLAVTMLIFGLSLNKSLANEVLQKQALKSMNEQLGQERHRADAANLAKSQFFTSASHDARQPLQAIALLSDALIRSKQLAPDDLKLVQRINTNLLSIRNLFNRVLDISRIESGAVQAVRETVSLQAMWSTLDAQLAEKAEAKGLWLRFAPTDRAIEQDAQLLERVLVNLIDNAIKFTDTGGVWVAYRQQRQCIEVRDSGIGLTKQDQAKIFDEFFQVGNSARKREEGTGQGLGLSIAKRLATLTGSLISVRSVAGLGSVFSVSVKTAALEHTIDVTENAQPAAHPAQWLSGRHMVVFDDDHELCELICDGLRQYGAHAVSYSQVGPFRNWLSHARPETQPLDLLITDFRLDGELTGLDVIRSVTQRYGPALPVIVVTGDTHTQAIQQVTENRKLLLLYKPVGIEDLAQQAAKLIALA